MITFVLAFGLALTAATQFRAGGLPVGPGEALLLVWLGLVTARQLICRPLMLNPALLRIGIFWFVMAVILCIGTIVGLLVEPFHYYSGMVRDTLAYTLVVCFSVMFALTLNDPQERREICWRVAIVSSVMLLIQIADGYGAVPMPGVNPWFWDRFRGWAENPNQLGFFAMVIALLCLHLADRGHRPGERVLALGLSLPAFMAGMMSHSDSFTIGMILAGGLFAALRSLSWIRNSDIAPTLRGAAVVLSLLALPAAMLIAAPHAMAVLETLEERSAEIYGENDQGDTRLNLWAEALDKGIESRLVGFGPGPHLTSKSYKRPPPNKFEAHNTFLDLFTQGGIVAVAAFLWITTTAFVTAARGNRPALAGLVLGLMVFGFFHYMVRHPIFWFGIVLCLSGTARQTRAVMPAIPRRQRPLLLKG